MKQQSTSKIILSENKKDIDYIFENIIGGGGIWQWLVILLIWPIGIASEFPLLLHLFTAYEHKHRCYIPGCDDENGVDITQSKNYTSFALPPQSSNNEVFDESSDFDSCKMYPKKITTTQTSNDLCIPESFDNFSTISCDSYVYDTSLFPETFTISLDLVCDKKAKRLFLGTIMMLGLLFGSLIGGRLSDRFGRKLTMIVSMVIIIPSVMFGGYSPNYICYAILRLITCTAVPCIWMASHSMALEVFGANSRKVMIVAKDLMWPIAWLLQTLMVYFVRNWVSLHLWTGACCLACMPIFFILPDSPRWLANNGQKEKAEIILLNAAKWNRKTLTNDQKEEIHYILHTIEQNSIETSEAALSVLDMFKKKHLKKTLILLLNWITSCLGSYTLTLNSTNLSGDMFLNFVVMSVVGDIPALFILMLTMKYFGRRFNLLYTQVVTGICCLILAFISKKNTIGVLVFFLIGKCTSGACFTLVYIITAELYPTNLRSQAVGFCSSVSRIFALVSPFVTTLADFWNPLPMLVLGLPALISGSLSYLIPETKGKELPQNMTDAINLQEIDKIPEDIELLEKSKMNE